MSYKGSGSESEDDSFEVDSSKKRASLLDGFRKDDEESEEEEEEDSDEEDQEEEKTNTVHFHPASFQRAMIEDPFRLGDQFEQREDSQAGNGRTNVTLPELRYWNQQTPAKKFVVGEYANLDKKQKPFYECLGRRSIPGAFLIYVIARTRTVDVTVRSINTLADSDLKKPEFNRKKALPGFKSYVDFCISNPKGAIALQKCYAKFCTLNGKVKLSNKLTQLCETGRRKAEYIEFMFLYKYMRTKDSLEVYDDDGVLRPGMAMFLSMSPSEKDQFIPKKHKKK